MSDIYDRSASRRSERGESMETSRHHMETDEKGVGKCSVPLWYGGMPAGFCDAPAFGARLPCREYRAAHSGEVIREDGRYAGYVPGLACPAHGGPRSRVFRDGNQWCAVLPGFTNLQESQAGFGDTPDGARKALGEG